MLQVPKVALVARRGIIVIVNRNRLQLFE